MDVMLFVWGANGLPQETECVRVKAKFGRKSESVSSSCSRKGTVCNEALHVTGLYGPGGKTSLFLRDWELAKNAFSCRMAMRCQEMHETWLFGDASERPAVSKKKKSLSLSVDRL